jgi:hypothetical protein
MQVTSPNILRSIINEAGRQADFYQSKSNTETECQFWAELEGLATEARRRSRALIIEMRDVPTSPLPIKSGEYCAQPGNPNIIKAFK